MPTAPNQQIQPRITSRYPPMKKGKHTTLASALEAQAAEKAAISAQLVARKVSTTAVVNDDTRMPASQDVDAQRASPSTGNLRADRQIYRTPARRSLVPIATDSSVADSVVRPIRHTHHQTRLATHRRMSPNVVAPTSKRQTPSPDAARDMLMVMRDTREVSAARGKPIKVPVIVYRNYSEDTLVDTGAGRNFMSKRAYDEIQAVDQPLLLQTTQTVYGADGHPISPVGEVDMPVTFIANDQQVELTTTLRFIVMKDLFYSFVFGLQSMSTLVTTYSFVTGQIHFDTDAFDARDVRSISDAVRLTPPIPSPPRDQLHLLPTSLAASATPSVSAVPKERPPPMSSIPVVALPSSPLLPPPSSSSSSSSVYSTRRIDDINNGQQPAFNFIAGKAAAVNNNTSRNGQAERLAALDRHLALQHRCYSLGELRATRNLVIPPKSSRSVECRITPTPKTGLDEYVLRIVPRHRYNRAGHRIPYTMVFQLIDGAGRRPHPTHSLDVYNESDQLITFKIGDHLADLDGFHNVSTADRSRLDTESVSQYVNPLNAISSSYDAPTVVTPSRDPEYSQHSLSIFTSPITPCSTCSGSRSTSLCAMQTSARDAVFKVSDASSGARDAVVAYEFDINDQLPGAARKAIDIELCKHRSVFDNATSQCVVIAHNVTHTIRTNDARPIKQNAYRATPANHAIIADNVQELLAHGYIRPSVSPWASPVILVPKPNNEKRMCVDYRKLNAVVVKDGYPLPRIEDCLRRFHTAKFLSIIDLKNAYHHIPLDEASKPLSAFVTSEGLYEWNVMTFGHTNAPGTFQRYMSAVLAKHINKYCIVYFDDIVIYSTNIDAHASHVGAVLSSLATANLSAKSSKCHFGYNSIKFLGHIVTEGRIRPDPMKTKAVDEFPTPVNVSTLRSFLGLANYYRNFISNFATIAAPLYHLTRKNVAWAWNSDACTAFFQLRRALVIAPCLASPDYDRPFILHTDASELGFGAVLTQQVDGVEHPISYMSTQLNDAQHNYSVTELECAAVVWAIKQYEYMLHDRHFDVITDHKAAEWLPTKNSPNRRLTRAFVYLSQFDYTVKHRPGKANANADALSRVPVKRTLVRQAGEEDDEDFNMISPSSASVHIANLTAANVHNCASGMISPFAAPARSPFSGIFNAAHAGDRQATHDLAASFTRLCNLSTGDTRATDESTTAARRVAARMPQSHQAVKIATRIPRAVTSTRATQSRAVSYTSYTIENLDERAQLVHAQHADAEYLDIINFKRCHSVPRSYEPHQIVKLRYAAERYSIDADDGALYYIAPTRYSGVTPPPIAESIQRLVIPRDYRLALLHLFHSSPFGGHLGISKTYHRLAARYYWSRLWDDTQRFVKQCFTCQQEKARRHVTPTEHTRSISATQPFEAIALDYIGPLPQSEDFKYILVIVDVFTRWAITVPCITQTAATTASAILTLVCCQHGMPRRVLTDQGSPFVASFLDPLWTQMGIEKLRTSAYHPQSNGLVERFNGTLKTILRALCAEHPSQWASKLAMATFAYNTAVHSATSVSPFFLVHIRNPHIPGDFSNPTLDDAHGNDAPLDYLADVIHQQSDVFAYINANIKLADETARCNEKSRQVKVLAVGDRVMFQSPTEPKWRDTSDEQKRRASSQKPSTRKTFVHPFNGPFVVTRVISPKVYEIQAENYPTSRTDIANISQLRYIPPQPHSDEHFNDDIDFRSSPKNHATLSHTPSSSHKYDNTQYTSASPRHRTSPGSLAYPSNSIDHDEDEYKTPSGLPHCASSSSTGQHETTAPSSHTDTRRARYTSGYTPSDHRATPSPAQHAAPTAATAAYPSPRSQHDVELRSPSPQSSVTYSPITFADASSPTPTRSMYSSTHVDRAVPLDSAQYPSECSITPRKRTRSPEDSFNGYVIPSSRTPHSPSAPSPSRATPLSQSTAAPHANPSPQRSDVASSSSNGRRRSKRAHAVHNYSDAQQSLPLDYLKRISLPQRKP